MYGGVGLWDLTSGKELPFLKLPGINLVLFEPTGSLLTNGTAGLLRWPVQSEPASAGLLRIGPPHKLSVPGTTLQIACSRDGKLLVSAQFQGALVLHADRPDQPVRLGPHDDARYVAVSPDRRWVATGSHTGTGVKIWDAQSGKLEKELHVDGTRVGFSPDGKWLWTELRLWEVGSWQEGPQIGGRAFAFSPDSKLLAVETGGAVRLVNPDTGREYVRLEDPNQDRPNSLSFSPDGTQLVASNNDSQSIHVWDLRAIRKQLAKMDLDWDLLPYPPPAADAGQPLRVEVDLGDLAAMIQAQESRRQGDGHLRSRQWEKAIAAYSKAVELEPESACALNNLAWLLATCSEAQFRDPTRAVELAARASKLTPREGNAWNTLGVAHYRAGEWKAAVVALTKSNELLGEEELSFNAFFLAMAHGQLGNKEEARSWQDRAVQWMEKNQPQNEELRRFRGEAAALLEVMEKKP
jgi:tetratricopeptide (TPR) repeat protein